MRNRLAVLLCLGLCGCATPYQSQGFTGGFTGTQIQDGIFRVSFKGNGYTSRERTEDFTLLRSAEVALENGYKYFIIMGENQETRTAAVTTPVTASTTGNVNVYGGNGYAYGSYNGTTTYSGGETYLIHKPSTSMMIQCFKEKPANVTTMTYDAEQVKGNLRKAYKLDEEVKKKDEPKAESKTNNFKG